MNGSQISDDDLERIALELDANENCRVLRKQKRRSIVSEPDQAQALLGLFVDVETTGLDPAQDEIIELAMVPFNYGSDGKIFEIREPYQGCGSQRIQFQKISQM